MDNQEEMEEFLEKYNLLRLNQEELEEKKKKRTDQLPAMKLNQ